MFNYFLRRFGQSLLVLIAMSCIVFLGVFAIGNPIDLLVNPQADEIERVRATAALGLDRPLYEQYFTFLKGAASGDLGRSFVFGVPALELILSKMPATIELALFAMVIAVAIGIPLGLVAGLRPDSLWDGLSHLLLPALNLALFKLSLLIRLTRAQVREAVLQDYVKFARAKGLSQGRVIGVHILKNIMIPIVTVIGLEFGSVIAFAIVTESIFAWPGTGKLLIDSINQLDRPVIVAYLMVIVALFIAINFIVDLVYSLLDPRVRLGQSSGGGH